jgi:hypothetical protein
MALTPEMSVHNAFSTKASIKTRLITHRSSLAILPTNFSRRYLSRLRAHFNLLSGHLANQILLGSLYNPTDNQVSVSLADLFDKLSPVGTLLLSALN